MCNTFWKNLVNVIQVAQPSTAASKERWLDNKLPYTNERYHILGWTTPRRLQQSTHDYYIFWSHFSRFLRSFDSRIQQHCIMGRGNHPVNDFLKCAFSILLYNLRMNFLTVSNLHTNKQGKHFRRYVISEPKPGSHNQSRDRLST